MNSSLLLTDDSLNESIRTDFEIETLHSQCQFSEGPIWNKEGFYLFSDIPQNIICKIQPGAEKETYLTDSGWNYQTEDVQEDNKGSNGLAFDKEDQLIICQHGNHGLARYNGTAIEPLATHYNEKRFNSPNDIIIHEDGRIFFSDPPYGIKGQKLIPEKYQPVAGVYCWNKGELQLLLDQYQYPNGVCLSADQEMLYICSNKPFERFVTQMDVRDFSKHQVLCNENGDGIECDRRGNIYLCAKEGIVIVDATGKRLGVIQLETIPANLCWGGEDGNDLFITARQNIFLIRNLQKA